MSFSCVTQDYSPSSETFPKVPGGCQHPAGLPAGAESPCTVRLAGEREVGSALQLSSTSASQTTPLLLQLVVLYVIFLVWGGSGEADMRAEPRTLQVHGTLLNPTHSRELLLC